MPKNVIQHHEWATRDPQRLMSFYGSIFDWKFQEAMPGYHIVDGVGGFFAIPAEEAMMPVGITNYVNVDDLAAKEALITAAGCQVYKSRQEVPGMGWFTIFGDPDGNMVAMWQSMNPPPAPKRSASTKKKAAKKKPTAKKKAATKKAKTKSKK
jgi:predicted enzyme related to lactoylglutathione lyase